MRTTKDKIGFDKNLDTILHSSLSTTDKTRSVLLMLEQLNTYRQFNAYPLKDLDDMIQETVGIIYGLLNVDMKFAA